jgi:hypothetical protein
MSSTSPMASPRVSQQSKQARHRSVPNVMISSGVETGCDALLEGPHTEMDLCRHTDRLEYGVLQALSLFLTCLIIALSGDLAVALAPFVPFIQKKPAYRGKISEHRAKHPAPSSMISSRVTTTSPLPVADSQA